MTGADQDDHGQHGHSHPPSEDPDNIPWTQSCDPDSRHQLGTTFQSSATQVVSMLTTASQPFSNLSPPTFSPSTPMLLLTASLSSQPFTSLTSSLGQKPTLSSISLSGQSSPNYVPQTMTTSTSPGKILAASFSSTLTSTVIDIITTSSPSQSSPSSSTFLKAMNPPHPSSQRPNSISTMSTGAKAGSLIGLILFLLLLLLILSFIFYARRRSFRYPRCLKQRPTSYARETEPLTSSTPEQYVGIEVIEAGAPKTSCDSNGVRWPEKVALKGETREIREWTEDYERVAREEGYERIFLESYAFWGRGG